MLTKRHLKESISFDTHSAANFLPLPILQAEILYAFEKFLLF